MVSCCTLGPEPGWAGCLRAHACRPDYPIHPACSAIIQQLFAVDSHPGRRMLTPSCCLLQELVQACLADEHTRRPTFGAICEVLAALLAAP